MATPAGWYDDGSGRQRWWDGTQWTDTFQDVQQQAVPQNGLQQSLSPENESAINTPKKPWFKRWWVWGIAAVVLLSFASALGGGGSSVQPSAETAPTAEEVTVETVVVPDVTGLPGDEARDALSAAGLAVDFEADSGKAVIAASNWDVLSTEPAAGADAEKGSTVTVQVTDAIERIKAENEKSRAEYAAKPIEATEAQVFCDNYADLQFPYGAKLHWILGGLAEEPIDGGGWYLKVEATVKNEYNAKRDINIECHVIGTNGAPVMSDFEAY